MTEDQMVNIIIWGEVVFVSLVGVWVHWDYKRKVNRRNKRLKTIASKRQKKINIDYFFGFGKWGEDEDETN